HALYDPQPGVYIQQLVCDLHEALDVPTFLRAWNNMVERHAVLRTGVFGEAGGDPLQFVAHQVQIPVEQQDWSGAPAGEQKERREELLEADRRRGFDMVRPPLMRLALVRRGEADWTCVWTYHHVLLDGRSHTKVLKDVFTLYDAWREGKQAKLDTPRP